jgi:cytochrome c553
MTFSSSVALATVYRTIGLVIMFVTIGAVVVYALVNVVFSGKAEVGSELELAPNRKPYLSDEELEGKKLDRALTWGLLTLVVIAVGLPVYWVMEPGRAKNEAQHFDSRFVEAGKKMFDTTANGGLNCAGCHGGLNAQGGVASYTLLKQDGSFDKQVNWKAPALNTVLLRYSRDEVTFILTYGRPFSPMPAWGIAGNGPLNDQQIQNLVDYLETIQIKPADSQKQVETELRSVLKLGTDEKIDYNDPKVGEALFNLGLSDGFAGGAYACGRCHTQGWSYASSESELSEPGCGALGPSLCGASLEDQFPINNNPAKDQSVFQAQIDFVTLGSEVGKRYGLHGQGTGRMPGFGVRPAEKGLFWIAGGTDGKQLGKDRAASAGMETDDMITAIVLYERSL